MNMKLLTSGQGFEFSGHCVETVSDSRLQKPMTLPSFYIQRCGTGWADRDMCMQQSICLCELTNLGHPNIFDFKCHCSVLICQKTAAQMFPGQ